MDDLSLALLMLGLVALLTAPIGVTLRELELRAERRRCHHTPAE